MRSRTYKIKNNKTALFWTGYGSHFTESGKDFSSYDSAAYELKRQISYKHQSIKDWISDAEVVEFEVITREVDTSDAVRAAVRSIQYDNWNRKYGHQFVRQFLKLCHDAETRGKYNYAVEVPVNYTEFRESMKNLGYSSRHYKKTDAWLWVEDDEVAMRMKLLDQVRQMVDLKNEEQAFEEELAKFRQKLSQI